MIFKRVYDLSGSKIPVKRLWISSMEDSAIREGFTHLKNGSAYKNLCEASVCRAKADWLIGMNATRAFTTKYYRRLAVGRVQTPTLAMLVERQNAIDGFVKEAHYKVTVEGNGICAVSENIKEEADSLALAEQCNGKPAVVSAIEKIRKKSMPPKLYDLTTLQREANRIFGYTAQETLHELQKLYEAKLVTYPRTDSQYITEDKEGVVTSYYVEKNGFIVLAGFIQNSSSGAVVSFDTTDFHIEVKEGSWLAFDSIIIDGKEFFLMEHEKYGKEAAWTVVDEAGKLIVDNVYDGFDQTVLQKIRDYTDSRQPVMEHIKQETSFGHTSMPSVSNTEKPSLENWQKYMENGEYLRSSEMEEEENYNMIDGRRNNKSPKGRKDRVSVLAKLRQKQAEIAKRSEKPAQQTIAAENMERRRK